MDKFRKELERPKRAFFTVIEEALERFSKTYPSAATNEDGCEYWVSGSGWMQIPKGRLNKIPRVIRESHNGELQVRSSVQC